MAEALAVLGIVSAIVQLVDFGSKVVSRFHAFHEEVSNGPKVYQDVRTRLPLILDLVKKIHNQIEAGHVDKTSQEVMLPVIQSCLAQVKALDDLFAKAVPKLNDSSWNRGKKAIVSIVREPEMEKIDLVLKTNCDLLVQAGTFHSVSWIERKEPSSQQQSVNVYVPQQQAFSSSPPPSYDGRSGSWSGSRSGSVPSAPIFMVPFQRDPKYLGRYAMDEIMVKFETQNQVALAGLGGVGKSQIAIEYCYLFKEKHPEAHVFWIFAGTTSRFEQGYQEIARRLGIRGWEDQKVDTLKLVYEWLSDEYNGEYLLIVDNADDASIFFERGNSKSLARYLPQSAKGSILVTTRDKRVGERLAGREKPVEVLPMSASEAKELLRSRIAEEDWSDVDAMRLIEELAYLPLAITQAAAFISENSLTVSEYLELLDTGDADLKDLLSEHLEDPRRDMDTENSVMRTWKLSFDQISKGKPRAAQILSLMAVLDHHGTPRVLLRKDGETEIAFRTALGALQAFSLITAGKGKDAAYKMHRLVALSTQKWLELTGTLRHWQTEALKVLSEKFPRQQTYENWAVLEALTPHAQLVFSFTFQTAMDLLQCAKLLDFAALYDMGKGRNAEAHDKCVKSLEIRESILPKDHPLTLESAQTLGEALLHTGDLASARAMLERAITGRDRVLGELHPDTLESVSDLTITLLELDDIAAAEETSLRALNGRKQVLGDDHPDTLVSLNIRSMLEQRKDNLVVAREMTERVLQGREKILGRSHPDTLMTLNNLAVLQYRQGDLDAAKKTLDFVIAGEENVLGAEGYDIQVSLTNMALVYQAQGQLYKAEQLHRRVVEMRSKILGPDHPQTLFSVKNIADVLSLRGDLGSLDRAEKMNQRAKRSGFGDGYEMAGALLRAGLLFD